MPVYVHVFLVFIEWLGFFVLITWLMKTEHCKWCVLFNYGEMSFVMSLEKETGVVRNVCMTYVLQIQKKKNTTYKIK